MASVVSINLNGPHGVVDKCQVIICLQVLSNLVKIRGIKCTCKVVSLNYHFRET
jgi:H2-forming N5,N10-methylenetetrahydromethanopterin dehydrogenase-like enzyme